MQVRFILGPAGSGKTCRCLAEIRAALKASPVGPPLVFLAPKQATFQLERQLLADPSLPGYTRLSIVSFERLASLVLERLRQPPGQILTEEGRIMVLRALLTQCRDRMMVFRASARLPGFAQQLSLVMREFQRHRHTATRLETLAGQLDLENPLAHKLRDMALIFREYEGWLKARGLQDANGLLDVAIEAIASSPLPLSISHLWLDGFAEMTPQEIKFLVALLPSCGQTTLAFCLNENHRQEPGWLSVWSTVSRTYRKCHNQVASLTGCEVSVEVLTSDAGANRFSANPALSHLERHWANPQPFAPASSDSESGKDSIRIVTCTNPLVEATLAAREILRYVRAGARYRDCAVLLRQFEGYHDVLRRVFTRYGIPFFLDRRESVSHHPLAELTRYSLRLVAFGWRHDDWFGALKTGLAPADEDLIDRLENEALARGWKGKRWLQPLTYSGALNPDGALETLRQRLVPPFEQFVNALARHQQQPTGSELASAVRTLWSALKTGETLRTWSAHPAFLLPTSDAVQSTPHIQNHLTVWEQMHNWLENVAMAFPDLRLPLPEWIAIIESGLAGLTVGVIPPSLDQVLIGTIDRSRNPDLHLAIVIGLNESVFPAKPANSGLLSHSDREAIEANGYELGLNQLAQLGQEQYYGYIACTRARRRLVLTCAARDAADKLLNPSLFLSRVKKLFPGLVVESFDGEIDWSELEHPSELRMLREVPSQWDMLHTRESSRHPLQESPNPESPSPYPLPQERVCSRPPGEMSNAEVQCANYSGKLPHLPEGEGWGEGETNVVHPADSPISPPAGICPETRSIPAVQAWLETMDLNLPADIDSLSPKLAEELYGQTLQASVSALEEFAACPFKFFVSRGLRAGERRRYELDAREQGTFQHQVLAAFHRELRHEQKRWRDVTAKEARDRIGRITKEIASEFHGGLLRDKAQNEFSARSLNTSLRDFMEVIIGWMAQYEFDPSVVELEFGMGRDSLPAWELDLGGGHRLAIHGKIDRVDLWVDPAGQEALGVVIDYKSSPRELDPLLLKHGIQLQLPAYLSLLRHLADPRPVFGASRITPAGVFYVNLRGQYTPAGARNEALSDVEQTRQAAYQHTGRFDLAILRKLDSRAGAKTGTQFKYRLKNDGSLHKTSREAMESKSFLQLLDETEGLLRQMGRDIFSGITKVDPYQKKTAKACNFCCYQPICRIDPWTHAYRQLANQEKTEVGLGE